MSASERKATFPKGETRLATGRFYLNQNTYRAGQGFDLSAYECNVFFRRHPARDVDLTAKKGLERKSCREVSLMIFFDQQPSCNVSTSVPMVGAPSGLEREAFVVCLTVNKSANFTPPMASNLRITDSRPIANMLFMTPIRASSNLAICGPARWYVNSCQGPSARKLLYRDRPRQPHNGFGSRPSRKQTKTRKNSN